MVGLLCKINPIVYLAIAQKFLSQAFNAASQIAACAGSTPYLKSAMTAGTGSPGGFIFKPEIFNA